jgi:hypothetical protein
MDRGSLGYLRRLLRPDADDILEDLTSRQHLKPHQPVSEALSDSAASVGFCPGVIGRALQWLQLDPAVAIGRLRRTQLTQLARCVHRFWRQEVPQNSAEAPTA